MPYVGRDLQRGNYLKLDDIGSSFNGSTTTFNLTSGGNAFFPGSAFSILVSLGGVVQEPESAYQIDRSQIIFATAPTSSSDFFCIALGVALGVGVPGHNTVGNNQLAKPISYANYFRWDSANNRVGINTLLPSTALDVVGSATFSGNVSIGGTLTYEDVANIDAVGIITARAGIEDKTLTAGRVVYAGTAGRLVDNANLTFNPTTLNTPGLSVTGVTTITGNVNVTGSGSFTKTSNNFVLVGSSNAGGASIVLDGDSNGDGSGTDYAYIEHDTSGNLNIVGDNPANASNIIFKTNSSTERLRIQSDGKVGIGTDSITANLHVRTTGAGGTLLKLETDMNDSVQNRSFYIEAPEAVSTDLPFRIRTANSMLFMTDNNEALTIDINGKVGVGTISPTDVLDVYSDTDPTIRSRSGSSSVGANVEICGGSSNDSQLILSSGTTSKYQFFRDGSQSDDLRIYDSANSLDIMRYRHGSYLHFGLNGKERFRINSNGSLNIGIGTESTAAANLVEIYVGATDDSYATIRGKYNRTNEYNRSEVRFGVEDNSNGRGFLAFATGQNTATERLHITSTGKVLVGDSSATTPSRNLDVRGAGHQQILIGSTNNAGVSLMVDGHGGGDGSGGNYSTFEAASDGHLKIRNYDASKNIIFGVGSNTGGEDTLILKNNGDLGLSNTGTNNPNTYTTWCTFTINGTSGAEIDFEKGEVLQADILCGQSGLLYTNRLAGDPHTFATHNGTSVGNRLRITSAGSVNIGGDYDQTTYKLFVDGSFAATTKSFVIDHPTKEKHKLRYACLEGPENSVYVRGRSSDSVIELPDYWIGLVHEDSITVNVTPIGNHKVWVESINNNSVTIGSDGSEYFYTVFAERKDVDKLEVEVAD